MPVVLRPDSATETDLRRSLVTPQRDDEFVAPGRSKLVTP
jgi:hypothetical protein